MAGIMTGNASNKLSPVLPGSTYPRFAQRVRRRYASTLALLTAGTPTRQSMQTLIDTLQTQGQDLGSALRTLRQLVLERLLTLDCDAGGTLETVTGTMTILAELALELAFADSQRTLEQVHGPACSAQGAPAQLCIVGMGKLGARELNVSSDIDLIVLYDASAAAIPGGTGRILSSARARMGTLRLAQKSCDCAPCGHWLALRPGPAWHRRTVCVPALSGLQRL